MHIICERSPLVSAFQAAAAVLPTRTPKPILQHIRLEVLGDSGSATVSATDLEVGVQLEVDGIQCRVPGVTILPADRFGAILREASDDVVELKTDGSTVEILAGKSRFELPVHDPHEYPQVAGFDLADGYFSLKGSLIRDLTRRTLFATSQDSNRYDLSGVLLELSPQKVIAISTDGRRLAKMEGGCESVGEPALPSSMTIVPSKSMGYIQRLFGDSEEVRLAVRENELSLSSMGVSFFSRLLEGRFPRWEMVIPKDREGHGIRVVVGPFLSALRQAAIVADQDSRGIDFDFQEGVVTLSASTADRGNCRVPMPIAYEGEPLQVRLDFRFLEEFLRTLEPDQAIRFSVKDHESAALCTTDDGYEYVLMPLSRGTAADAVETVKASS